MHSSDIKMFTASKLSFKAGNIFRTGNDIIKADFMHAKRTTFSIGMKIGIRLEELK